MRFLASLLVAGLVSAASAFSAVDAGLLALVPPDAQLVSGVHVSQSRVSPFGQFVISQFQTEPGDLQNLVNQTGFDPGKDVSEVLMGFNGKPKEGNGLVLARGNFDPERIRTAAIAKGATVESYLGTDLIVCGGTGPRLRGAVGAFISRSRAVAGDRDSVKYAIAHANMTQPPGLNPALAAKINAISASADAWFVSFVRARPFFRTCSIPVRQARAAEQLGLRPFNPSSNPAAPSGLAIKLPFPSRPKRGLTRTRPRWQMWSAVSKPVQNAAIAIRTSPHSPRRSTICSSRLREIR